jgi:hypothetical protein
LTSFSERGLLSKENEMLLMRIYQTPSRYQDEGENFYADKGEFLLSEKITGIAYLAAVPGFVKYVEWF